MNMRHYTDVPAGACSTSNAAWSTWNSYGPAYGPLKPVVYNASAATLTVTYPVIVTNSGPGVGWQTEAVRLNGTTCSFCPYSEYPEVVPPEYLNAGGLWNVPSPMYGMCFNGQPSTANTLSCVQDQLLYPPDFVGEYFYPDQVGPQKAMVVVALLSNSTALRRSRIRMSPAYGGRTCTP